MTSHHVPKSSRLSENSPTAFNWSLDQELKDHITRINNLTSHNSVDINQSSSSLPQTPSTRRERGLSNNINKERELSLSLSTPVVPFSPSHPAAETDPETLHKIKSWMKAHYINCINYLLRHYTVTELDQAAEDFETAVKQGVHIKSPSGFLRSLLK